jgi:hypothetical protein
LRLQGIDPYGFGPIGEEFLNVNPPAPPTKRKKDYDSINTWLNNNQTLVYSVAGALLVILLARGRR